MLSPMLVTLEGSSTEVRDEHSQKAKLPAPVAPVGILIEAKDEQFWKA